MLSLGEYSETIENFKHGSDQLMVYSLFSVANFWTQITMFNMLIAIMGDVFDRLMEQQDVQATKNKLQILAEQAPILSNLSPYNDKEVYMIVVEPECSDNEDDEEDWNGTIKELTRITKMQMHEVKAGIVKKVEKMEKKVENNSTTIKTEIAGINTNIAMI